MNPIHRKATDLLRRRSEPQQRDGMVPQKRPPSARPEMPGLFNRMRERVRGTGPTVMKRPPGM